MKRLSSLLFWVLVFQTVFAQSRSNIELSTSLCSLGDIYKDSAAVSVKIGFRNTGSEKLLIYKCTTQCPCMTVAFPKSPVAPGDTGVLVLTYNAKNQHAGEFRKHFTVVTNSEVSPHKRVFVRGRVLETRPAVTEPPAQQAKEEKKASFFGRLLGK